MDLTSSALSESMDLTTMTKLAREFISDYDLYERTGFPESFSIPRQDAAKQIVRDIKSNKLFPQFVKINNMAHFCDPVSVNK